MEKVLHVPFTYHPDPCGGTEIYVGALARELRSIQWDSIVAAPGLRNQEYANNGVFVHRFATAKKHTRIEDLYGNGDPDAASNFEKILDRVQPELVHLHAMSPAVSIRLVKSIKERNIPLVYTYHTPTASCQRGTLLKWGNQVCDGIMDPEMCAPCSLHGRGVSKAIALGLTRISKWVGKTLEQNQKEGGLWTALRTPNLVKQRLSRASEFFHLADHIFAVCDWVRELLLRNGIPQEKLTLSRQGLCHDSGRGLVASTAVSEEGLPPPPCLGHRASIRMAFLGRLDPTKGPHVLIQALNLIPTAKVCLDLFGIAQGEGGQKYANHLKSLTGQNPRIRFLSAVPADKVVGVLSDYDILAVPSQCLETGPMVVLEAFAAGIPVIGSRLGGIQELVLDGITGHLVEAAQSGAWAKIIQEICQRPERLRTLCQNIKPPRTMVTVAQEMKTIYQTLLAKKHIFN